MGGDVDCEQRLNQLILDIQSLYGAVMTVAQPFSDEKFKDTLQGQVADYLLFIQRVLSEAIERATAPKEGSIQGDLNV